MPFMSNLLFKLENLIEGTVVKRPSKYIKSPYVADVVVEDQSVLAHTASLGCRSIDFNGSNCSKKGKK